MSTSVIDYIFRELAISYLSRYELAHVSPDDIGNTTIGGGVTQDPDFDDAQAPAPVPVSRGFVRSKTVNFAPVIVGGKAMGMQFMDDAIWQKLQQGIVSPEEAYMKCIEKKRFRNFLPPESARLADSGGGN